MAVATAYLSFVPLVAVCFWKLPLRAAVLTTLLGGWLLLPVAEYPAHASGPRFWWVVGVALPSDMLVTKAWVPPLLAFCGAALRRFDLLRSWRPSIFDLPMALWCLWPFVDGLLAEAPAPSAGVACLYVAAAWGLPWIIGRVWFAGEEGRVELARGLALAGLACLPFAVLEGVRPAMLYELVYGVHPHLSDVERYFRYRPLAFFEHGNLYGLWIALCALAAVWLAIRHKGDRGGARWTVIAAVDVGMALAAQSVGAILLLLAGMLCFWGWRLRLVLPVLGSIAAAMLVIGAVHLSGQVPLRELAREAAGQQVIDAFRAAGRGSFPWRISQDTKTLAVVREAPLTGTARWDWWRPYGARPWGQGLLLIGQFGLIGLALAWGSLITAATAALARLHRRGTQVREAAALPLALIVLFSLADALLNAWFFAPAIVAAGAVAANARDSRAVSRSTRRQGRDVSI